MPAQDENPSPRSIRIADYDYGLPEERIAQFPLEQRDASKLLLYRGGKISHTHFREISEQLPDGALLVFNDTKVIHARLHFNLPNGAPLEILCLEPLAPAEYQQNFSSNGPVRWRCLVGGNRKWKRGTIEKVIEHAGGQEIRLRATRQGRSADAFDILFEWNEPGLAFGELLAQAGILPLPPYLNRENVPSDEDRYQTVYAREQGSVAAPTAGLHFTEEVFQSLEKKGVEKLFVTLHVGAGTFRPVKTDTIGSHPMHEESTFIRREVIAALKEAIEAGRPIIPVGTTSTRLLESLYWHGVEVGRRWEFGIRNSEFGSDRREPRTDEGGRGGKSEVGNRKSEGGSRKSEGGSREGEGGRRNSEFGIRNSEAGSREGGGGRGERVFPGSEFQLRTSQWQPYETDTQLPPAQALQAILDSMDEPDSPNGEALEGQTRLIIAPGYRFRLISGMITNFHQPRSTLLLLIAALIGDDWRRAYQYALDNDFRFLSYGDSSLLLPLGPGEE